MVRVIDIDVPAGTLAGRIAYALFRSSTTIFVFYYLPTHFSLLASHVPATYFPIVEYLANSFSNSPLPYLGIVIALLAFVETIIKGTWVYGAVMISTSVSWLLFDFVLLSKGVLFSDSIPSGLIQAYQLPPFAISLIVRILIAMVFTFLIVELVSIVRGIRIIRRNRKKKMIAQVPKVQTGSKVSRSE